MSGSYSSHGRILHFIFSTHTTCCKLIDSSLPCQFNKSSLLRLCAQAWLKDCTCSTRSWAHWSGWTLLASGSTPQASRTLIARQHTLARQSFKHHRISLELQQATHHPHATQCQKGFQPPDIVKNIHSPRMRPLNPLAQTVWDFATRSPLVANTQA